MQSLPDINMDNYRIPPSPAWFVALSCSPENGLLYLTGNHASIAYIPPVKSGANDASENAASIQVIQTKYQLVSNYVLHMLRTHVPQASLIHFIVRFKGIACDPDWSATKYFVTLNEQNIVWVWDLESQKVCRGHKAHVLNINDDPKTRDLSLGGVMCITNKRQVLSIDRNAFVRYCLVSNTFTLYPDGFLTKRGQISILKASPYSTEIVAAGYRNGLIVIGDCAGEL